MAYTDCGRLLFARLIASRPNRACRSRHWGHGIKVKLKRASLDRSWTRLIANILRQAEPTNRVMLRNQKLTKVIAGRTIKAVTTGYGGLGRSRRLHLSSSH
jgi:hypothetical protein